MSHSRLPGLLACAGLVVGPVACHQLDFSPRVAEGDIDIYDDLFSVSVPDEDHAVRRCRTLFVYLDQTPVLGFVTSPRTAGQRQAHSGSLASVDGPGSGPRSGLLRTGRIGCTERSTCAVRWMVTHPEVRFPRGFRFADIRCN